MQTILSRSASRNSRKFQGHHGTSRTHENSTCVEFLEAPLRTYTHAYTHARTRARMARGSRQRFATFTYPLVRARASTDPYLILAFCGARARETNAYKNYIFRLDAFRYAASALCLSYFKIAVTAKRGEAKQRKSMARFLTCIPQVSVLPANKARHSARKIARILRSSRRIGSLRRSM